MEQASSTESKLIHIAVAEDHKMIRDMVVSNINSLKDCVIVYAASDGRELLDWLMISNELPDMCILDINMPELNGYDTQSAIKKRWPRMKTLAMSIFDEEDCIVQMLKNGANGFVSKNWGVKKLEEAILSIYEHGMFPVKDSPDNILFHSKGLPILTEREKEYITLSCSELNNEEIAQKMCVSIRTLERHREKVYHKTNVNTRADLILYVKKTGIVFMK